MNYDLTNIHTARSYEALKRNGFSDIDVVAYYGTPIADRPMMLRQRQVKIDTRQTVLPSEQGTQKCTAKADIDAIRDMALEYMEKDWIYRGRVFNLSKLGWSFNFFDRKGANGMCSSYRKKIFLSAWIIENGEREMEGWINTMVHEISHAINNILGGRGHDRQWRTIFLSFGGSGDRCSKDVTFTDLINNPKSKYTLICPNGHTSLSHKLSRVAQRGGKACGVCCREHNGGKFSSKYILKQIQNY